MAHGLGSRASVEALLFAPLEEAGVAGEAEAEIAGSDAIFQDLVEVLRSRVEILGAGGRVRLGWKGQRVAS
jgi:hypothetical protein